MSAAPLFATTVVFTVIGEPAPQGSKRAILNRSGRISLIESSKAKLLPWRQEIAATARGNLRAPLDGAVRVDLVFYLPRRKVHGRKSGPEIATKRPDSDKLARACLDALAGVAYADDSQVTTLNIRKRIAEPGESPRVSIRVGHDLDDSMSSDQ